MSNVYECAICQHINHSSRLHCSVCNTVPKEYSPVKQAVSIKWDGWQMTPIVAAHGCERANKQMNVHVKLRTMAIDYYAEA